MYKNKIYIGRQKSDIFVEPQEVGESIEEMVRRVTENNEPIDSSAPVVYTPEKDGVLPQYDIRTDRQEIAIDAADKFAKSDIAKRDEDNKPEDRPSDEPKNE